MPDYYANVGQASSLRTSGQAMPLQADDEPALATMRPMEMSVPIEPVAPTKDPGEIPHEDEQPEKPHIPAAPPLQANVRPFAVPEPRVPATEYVSVFTKPIPRLVPHYASRSTPEPVVPLTPPEPLVIQMPPALEPVRPVTQVPPTPEPPQPVAPIIQVPPPEPIVQRPPLKLPPQPAPLPVSTGQTIGPIIRKRAPTYSTMKIVAPVSPPAVSSDSGTSSRPVVTPPPEPDKAEQPVSAIETPKPVVAEHTPISPPSAEAVPVASSMPKPAAAPVEAPLVPATPPSIPSMSLMTGVVGINSSSTKPLMIFSQNTRAVWHMRRSGKALYLTALAGLFLVLIGLIVYWRSIGSPTNVQNIPLLRLH